MNFFILILCGNTIASMINTNPFVDFAGPVGDILRALPRLKRLLPGGWKHYDASSEKSTSASSYFSTWSLLDDTKLDHIVEHVDGGGMLGGVSGEVVVREICVYCTCWWYSLCNLEY